VKSHGFPLTPRSMTLDDLDINAIYTSLKSTFSGLIPSLTIRVISSFV